MHYIQDCYVFADSDNSEQDTEKPAKACSSLSQNRKSEQKISREVREYAAQRARARRQVPRCVMLMGLPASGKSTFAKKLAASAPNEWTVINQDCLGKKQCIALAGKAGRKNRVIIDRCHPTTLERQEWYNILGSPPKGEIALVYFAAGVDTCIERANGRTSHETIPEGKGERIVKCVAKVLEGPSRHDEDMFGTIEIVNTFEESINLLNRWGIDNNGANEG